MKESEGTRSAISCLSYESAEARIGLAVLAVLAALDLEMGLAAGVAGRGVALHAVVLDLTTSHLGDTWGLVVGQKR